jgi:polyisoprenoid-binding protein YceI
MSKRNTLLALALCGIGTVAFAADNSAAADATDAINLAVEGAASFIANTNMPAVSIKGKSTALKAKVTAHRGASGLQIDSIEAILPVKTLQTGMGVRDEHMRKYIFTTKDGQVPDVLFRGENVTCPTGGQTACTVAGNLTIRGVSHPFSLPLKVKEDNGGFKASGESIVKLSDFGIEQPSQFGVKTDNDVQVKLEFVAKPGPAHVASAGGVR